MEAVMARKQESAVSVINAIKMVAIVTVKNETIIIMLMLVMMMIMKMVMMMMIKVISILKKKNKSADYKNDTS